MTALSLPRRLLAEFLGTAMLVAAVVGSGVMAATLSPHDVGLQLLENSTVTAFALAALILIFGPVSGAHFNPVVSLADWWLGRRGRTGLRVADLAGYLAAQVAGAIGGSILANLMFALPAVDFSTKQRFAGHLWLGEVVATTPSRPAASFAVTGTPVPSIAAYSLPGSGDGGSGTSLRVVIALARLRSAAAFAAPLASADLSTRLAVRCTPARSASSPAAFANGPAAATLSFIAASPWDMDVPATPSPASLGGRPRPQAAQWYQARETVTGPGTVSKVLSR